MFERSATISNTGAVMGSRAVFFRLGHLTIHCKGNYGDIRDGKVYVDGVEVTPFDSRITKFALPNDEGMLMDVDSFQKQEVFKESIKDIEKIINNQTLHRDGDADLSTFALISRSMPKIPDEKISMEQDKLKHYSKTLTEYIASLNNKPKNSEVIKDLKLTEHELKQFDSLVDHILETIPNIPVRLNSRVYNLDTLLQLPEKAGIRLDPVSQEEFFLRDIQDARDVQNAIQEIILSIKADRAKEKAIEPSQTIVSKP